ncbi:MAG: hypothetical protein V7719_14120 [Psychroserpens sp.]|uniref:hypothetical protein n=1 Tax=Psychroserpens sp. TaxID=2020870 RepID=UPI0030032B9F
MKYISAPTEKISSWFVFLLKEMQNRMMSIIFILLIFMLLWYVPQVNDLILVLNQTCNHWLAVPMFFTSLIVFAFFISATGDYFSPPDIKFNKHGAFPDYYSESIKYFKLPKDAKEVFLDKKKNELAENIEFKETRGQYIRRVFPKVLGSILILVAAFAINHTFAEVYNGEDIVIGGDWSFIVVLALMFLMVNQRIAQWVTALISRVPIITKYGPIAIVLLSFILIVILGFLNQGGTRGDSIRLFYALILLTVLFLTLTLSYNSYILFIKRKIGGKLIIVFIGVILISYIILFFNPLGLEMFTPISITMICVIGIYTSLNILKIIGHKVNLPILGLFLMVSVGLAIYNANKLNFNHYEASSTDVVNNKPSDRLSLNEYSNQWVKDRLDLIKAQDSLNPFPIIIVSAEGGGSRAGLWSFLVQSYLFDKNPDYFEKYLFSMTGASGGGVGNNMFYAQAYELLENPSAKPLKYRNWSPEFNCDEDDSGFEYRASTIYNQDYLSSSVASVMGRDLFKNITDIGTFCDRGALLEFQWEEQYKKTFERTDNPLKAAYLDLMPKKGEHTYIRPLIITNVTELQSGERVVISPVSVASDTNNMAAFRDLLAIYPDQNRMIKRSTAMSMNARFPYLSPSARITGVGQFGDAGYYNNIGGDVSERLKIALVKALDSVNRIDSTFQNKYVIKNLVISNFSEKPDKVVYSTQLLAPLSTIASATFAHPKESEKTFANAITIQSKRVEIPMDESSMNKLIQTLSDSDGKIEPVIPLGRYLSRAAVRSLEFRLKEVEDNLNTVVPKS